MKTIRNIVVWFVIAIAVGAGLAIGAASGAALLRSTCITLYGGRY